MIEKCLPLFMFYGILIFHKLSRLHSLFQALVRQLWENLHNRLLSRFLYFPTKLRDDVTRQ